MQTNERMFVSEPVECSRVGVRGTEADEQSAGEPVLERGSVDDELLDDTIWFEC